MARKKKTADIIIKGDAYEVVGKYSMAFHAQRAIKRLGHPHQYTPNPDYNPKSQRSAKFLVVKPWDQQNLFEGLSLFKLLTSKVSKHTSDWS